MKQNITIGQLNELSEKAKRKLIKWEDRKYWDYGDWEDGQNLPSIGQMIEFLGKPDIDIRYDPFDKKWRGYIDGSVKSEKELCDLFWGKVKEKLEK